MTFFSHQSGFPDFIFLFPDFPYLYYVKCHIWPFPHKKNTFFYSVYTFDNTTSQNIGGTDAWAVPTSKFGGTVPPVPLPRSPPLLLWFGLMIYNNSRKASLAQVSGWEINNRKFRLVLSCLYSKPMSIEVISEIFLKPSSAVNCNNLSSREAPKLTIASQLQLIISNSKLVVSIVRVVHPLQPSDTYCLFPLFPPNL